MTNRRTLGLAALAVAWSISGETSVLAQEKGVVKIGLLAGLSGDYAPWAKVSVTAAQIAADEINAAGGINGQRLELAVVDNKSTVEGVISGWKRLVEVDGVIGVGSVESDGGLALIQDAANAKVPVICAACGSPQLATLGGNYVYRLTGGDEQIGVALAQLALDKSKSVATFTQTGGDATETISAIFSAAFQKGGGTVLTDARIASDAVSFRSELENAVGNGGNLFVSTGLETGVRLLADYQRRGYEGAIYVTPELIAPEIADHGNGYFSNRLLAISSSYDTQSAAYKSFAARYRAKTGNEPSPSMYEPNYYDQVILLALAATAAEENTGEGIRRKLRDISNGPGVKVSSYAEGVKVLQTGADIDYVGASGEIDFNEHGVVSTRYSKLLARDGKWVEDGFLELNANLQ